MTSPSLVGKTITSAEISDSLLIRFTDGSVLEISGDYYYELNGDTKQTVICYLDGAEITRD